MRKYNNINYIFELDFKEGYELILKAFEVDLERTIWEKWLVDYSKMNKSNFTSFQDYKKATIKPRIVEKQLTKDELLAQANTIQNKISQKRGEE